jgi:predicted MFS family arabinose efflux permease
MTFGPATGGFLAKSVGFSHVFLISGCLLLAVALLSLLVLPKGTPRRKTELYAVLAGSRELFRNRRLVACLLVTMGCCIGFGIFLTFLPLHAASLGHDPARVGLIFTAQAVTNVVSRVPIGGMIDRADRRKIVAVGLVCLAAALAGLGQQAQFSGLVVCAVFLGIGMALTFTTVGAMIADLAPAVQRGLAMGMYNSCIYMGMMAGSTAMGIALKRIGYPEGFAAAGGVVLVSLLLFFLMMREKPPHDTGRVDSIA